LLLFTPVTDVILLELGWLTLSIQLVIAEFAAAAEKSLINWTATSF